jgi:hypothetical protein
LATYTFPKVNLILPAYALFFGNTMDIYTTIQGILVGNSESNPMMANLINDYGFSGFAIYKTGIILAAIGLIFLANWITQKRRCKPEDVYFARRFSHFGLWLVAASYVPIVANNLLTFYIKIHGATI